MKFEILQIFQIRQLESERSKSYLFREIALKRKKIGLYSCAEIFALRKKEEVKETRREGYNKCSTLQVHVVTYVQSPCME